MFKKTEESVYDAVVFQRNSDIKMEYRDIDVLSAKRYFNQKGKVHVS